MAKVWAEGFYHSKEWRDMRGYILKRDRYTCVRCGAPGTEVHHITRLNPQNISDRSISLNPSKLELLCDNCHKREHDIDRMKEQSAEDAARRAIKPDYVFDSDGNIVPPGVC